MSEPVPEKVVYFVRHGQSVGNATGMFQGPGSPLAELGQLQAAHIARRVARLSFETLIASPFTRAKETAEAIAAATGKELELSPLFVERMKPDSIHDKTRDDPEAVATRDAWERSLHTPGMRVENGENFDDLMARADRALAFLEARAERALVS